MSLRRGAALVLLLATALGLAAVLGAREGRRRSIAHASDGSQCASCHDTPAHPSGEHAALECTRCHELDDDAAAWLGVAAAGIVEPATHDAITACAACHPSEPGSSLAAEGHRAHAGDALTCTSCHADPHSDAAASGCDGCHADVPRHGPTADVACTTCHSFGAESEHEDLASIDRGATLAGVAEVGADRVHGAMDCRRCHDPHADPDTTPPLDCQSCHRGHVQDEALAATPGHRDCGGCHEPHAPLAHPAGDCVRCHDYPEAGRGWQAQPLLPDGSGGVAPEEQALVRTRIIHEGRCETCHEAHTWTASIDRCHGCHEEETATTAALPAAAATAEAHGSCTSCHEPHAPQPTSEICTRCHEDVHALSTRASAPAAHRDCLSCHDPHTARPDAATACASCHHDEHTQTLGLTAQHRDCTSCHAQHGPPLAGATSACTGCHAEPAAAFARAPAAAVPSAHACAGCHQPHAFAADAGAVTRCASCHTDTVGAHASHVGTCTSCHTAHGAPRGAAADCSQCHADVHPTVPGHADCTDCHAPHHAAADALRACTSCHGAEVRAGASWPTTSPHAGDCASCHTPHAEGTRARCEPCHAEQATSAHLGAHTACTDCHAPHEAAPSSPAGWWQRCASCHQAEATAVASVEGVHGDCSGCHRTPGPPLPSCQRCHARETLPLEHASHASDRCERCHVAHGRPTIVRSTCLACHQEQQAHFPDAASCQTCHPFSR